VARGIEPVDGEELRAGKGGEALATTELERGGGRAPAGSMGWLRVAGLEDLPPGSALEVRHGRRVYALFRLGDSITCLDGLWRIVAEYVAHYNEIRLHSAIGYVTPKDRLEGRQGEIFAARKRKLAAARARRRDAAPQRGTDSPVAAGL
jgi:hypothetical protein